MSQVTEENRKLYAEYKAQYDAARLAAEPQRLAYEEAMKPAHELQEKMAELVGHEDDVMQCEGCGTFIFDGDKHTVCDGGECFCYACSPTYADLLSNPSNFGSNVEEDELMTPEEAQQMVDAHLAAGGSLEDKVGL